MLRALMLLSACQYLDIRTWVRFEELGLEPQVLLDEGPSLWETLGINERGRAAMTKALGMGWIERERDACAKLGVRILTCRDPLYPPSLLDLDDAPLLLYVWGERFSLKPKTVGVVGTRRCSPYASSVAREIGHVAATCGWSVISGGAKGVDAASHNGCLEGGGMTVAVLGTGVDVVYPSENRDLFDRIRRTGALFSEYRLGTKGEAWRFPKRNRIIAGLSSHLSLSLRKLLTKAAP